MTQAELGQTLLEIQENDANYGKRYILVLKAMYLAASLGYETGIRVDSADEETIWWVSFIVLPNIGEISWHNPSKVTYYSGYDTEEKYARCRKYNSVM